MKQKQSHHPKPRREGRAGGGQLSLEVGGGVLGSREGSMGRWVADPACGVTGETGFVPRERQSVTSPLGSLSLRFPKSRFPSSLTCGRFSLCTEVIPSTPQSLASGSPQSDGCTSSHPREGSGRIPSDAQSTMPVLQERHRVEERLSP